MVKQRWHDKRFEREVLDPALLKELERIGIMGESISKQVISGSPDPALKAVDKGRLRASLTHEVVPSKLLVRVGTNVKYAIHVFFGTAEGQPGMTRARPVLRTMLHILRGKLK